VIFEAGMALGAQPDRTILVELGKSRPFSDILGRLVIKIDNTSQRRAELIDRLKVARCAIEIQDESWLVRGNFSV